MRGRHNADVECNESKVEGEESSRTVNCLRGRLLAERMASRTATEEADQLGIRLLEVEMQLEKEGKSRKRAEKKLKLLTKRLQRFNISQRVVAADEETKHIHVDKSPKGSLHLEEIFKDSSSHELLSSCSSISSSSQLKNQESCEVGSAEDSYLSCAEQLKRIESCGDEEEDEEVDNRMAIVPVETKSEKERVDPEILDATVKQVLESLKRAKEQLQTSINRKGSISITMIQVG